MGIDSISLNPDTVLKTTQRVLETEKQLGRPPRESPGRRPQGAML
jgi:pyruvate,water dikinase